jgi:hypothetical protein
MGARSLPQVGNDITLRLHVEDTIIVPVLGNCGEAEA